MIQPEEKVMLGGKIGPAVGGLIGAPIGLIGGLLGGRSKKRAEIRQCQMAADAAWSRHCDRLPLHADIQALRDEVDKLQRIVAGADRANEVAAALSPAEYVVPPAAVDPVTGKPWHHVNFLRELNRTTQMDGTFPADRPAPFYPPLP